MLHSNVLSFGRMSACWSGSVWFAVCSSLQDDVLHVHTMPSFGDRWELSDCRLDRWRM